MGKSSQPTIGYWYLLLLHFGWGRGPLDALLEIRGGEKTAWAGEQTVSGTITINAENLWGGEKAEGGILGDFDVMMGEPTQAPNAYLAANLGAQQTAYRGKSSGVFKGGKWGAFNPYPKAGSFKLRRILKGWDDDVCWYPAKAPIPYTSSVIPPADEIEFVANVDLDAITNAATNDPVNGITLSGFSPLETMVVDFPSGGAYQAWKYQAPTNNWYTDFSVTGDDGIEHWHTSAVQATAALALAQRQAMPLVTQAGSTAYTFWINDTLITDNVGGVSLRVRKYRTPAPTYQPYAMNPAHMLYMSIVGADFQGEPAAMINAASFIAAADKLFAEGFGLCTTYDPTHETVEQFQARICNLISASLSQSRVDGQYYLTLIRGDYVLAALPILADDDILEYQEEPSDPLESVNQVTVEWFDPERKEKRATTPLQSLGAIMASGGILAETAQYPEIPYEDLALRVAARDLSHKATPLKRFQLTTNRIPYAWRAGQFFRLQAPRRGIADMVCQVGEIDAGTPRSGTMQLVAIQDVSGMPSTVYVTAEPGVDTSEPQIPTRPAAQQILEVPYVDLAGTLSTADLAALAADAGYMLAMAKRGTSGLNYTLFSGADAEPLVERGTGDWCPTALVVEAAASDAGDVTAFTLSGATGLSLVVVGTGALWGDEMVRVDALDAVALTITLGRGCGDTVPRVHAAGERIWFYEQWSCSDAREYVDGEVVRAKLLTRTATQLLDPSLAVELTTTMDQRAARPYPPGKLQFNSAAYADHFNGLLTLSWAHRDRVLQADQLVDTTAISVGPEAGTTYRVRLYNETGTLVVDDSSLTGTSYSWSSETGGDIYWSDVKARLTFDGPNNSTDFVDVTGKVWTAFGNAKVTTARSKFGGASGAFDGTGDYISTPNHADFNPGTGDFAIEGWVWLDAINAGNDMISNYQNSGAGITFAVNGAGKLIAYLTGDGVDITGATTLVTGQWYWVQLVRESGTLKVGLNGVLDASVANTANVSSTAQMVMGGLQFGASLVDPINGNLDDWRFTRRARAIALPSAAMPLSFGDLNYRVRVRLDAHRNGLTSWQEHDITVPRSGYGFAYGYWYGG